MPDDFQLIADPPPTKLETLRGTEVEPLIDLERRCKIGEIRILWLDYLTAAEWEVTFQLVRPAPSDVQTRHAIAPREAM